MKRTILSVAFALALGVSAFAQGESNSPAKASINWYGFIRNYFVYDSHASSAGTEDLYYYMPSDNDAEGRMNFVALTSRMGFDVKGYEVEGYKLGAKVETDFYAKNGTTAILRLRQAYLTIAGQNCNWKIGQAWHPMAADLPDIFSLESGAPFGPFSRTPQVTLDFELSDGWSATLSALWQMQYTSTGPDDATADYMKYGKIPELYAGLNLKYPGSILRLGADFLSILPYTDGKTRLNTLNLFQYGQFTTGSWTIKEKITYANDGSHMNMVGGYGVGETDADGVSAFYATRNVSAWATALCKIDKHWNASLFLGVIKGFGTGERIVGEFWGKNNAASVNRMVRFQPEVTYNLGKLCFGLEYMMTGVEYGKHDALMLVKDDLHWVSNNRIQMMVKYSF